MLWLLRICTFRLISTFTNIIPRLVLMKFQKLSHNASAYNAFAKLSTIETSYSLSLYSSFELVVSLVNANSVRSLKRQKRTGQTSKILVETSLEIKGDFHSLAISLSPASRPGLSLSLALECLPQTGIWRD